MSAPSPSTSRLRQPVDLLRPVVTLVLLFGMTWVSFKGAFPSVEHGRLAVLVGFLLLASSLSGAVAAAAGLPRITGFILVGIVAGPSLLGLMSRESVEDLRLIDSFALALIAMLAGGELRLAALKPHARTITVVTLFVTVVVAVGMAAAVMAVRPFVPFLAEMPLPAAAGVAVLLGIWSANSSPDLTVAVIEEKRARGSLVEVLLGVTIVKDVVVIVLFTLALALVAPLLDPTRPFSPHALLELGREVGGALVLGGAGGWIFSQYLGDASARPRSPLATFLFAYVLVVLCAELHLELLLAGVAAGLVIENLSPAGDRMIQGIRSVAVVIFAFFFATAGASLDLAAVARFGPAALALFLARVGLTRWAARKGAGMAGSGDEVRERAWLGLISQGGVSLGLVLLIKESFPQIGAGVVALAMSVIIGNILGGPVLLGRALAGSGDASPQAGAEGEAA